MTAGKIYTDFSFLEEFESAESKSSDIVTPDVKLCQINWGIYGEKPKAQEDWDFEIAKAVDSIADFHPHLPIPSNTESLWAAEYAGWRDGFQGKDIRPRIKDSITGEYILVDSGAMVSVFPRSKFPNQPLDSHVSIKAINKTTIPTYGKQKITVRIGRKHYAHEVLVADIDQPVIGWDFCRRYLLSLVWSEFGDLYLWDPKAKIKTLLQITANDRGKWPNMEGYTVVDDRKAIELHSIQQDSKSEEFKSFQDWSAKQKQLQNVHIAIPEKYMALIRKHPGILECDFKASKVKHGVIHRIETGSNTPCQAKVRQIMPGSPKYTQGEKDWKDLERLGIVVPVNPQDGNLWTSALHLAPKPDGTYRACGDFRALNDKTTLDGFALPNIRHFMSQIKGSRIFSKVDLVKAFHQIPLDPESMAKTTILTPWGAGAYQFARLPMGLKNSAQSFQRLMAHVLSGIQNIFVYLDDVLVYSENEDEHMKTLTLMFQKLEAAGLAISPKKCVFGEPELDFLGYRVTKDGISPLPKKIEAIAKFPSPEKQKHLLGYLGALNYYRRSLPRMENKNPAEILQPLYLAATIKLAPQQSFPQYWK